MLGLDGELLTYSGLTAQHGLLVVRMLLQSVVLNKTADQKGKAIDFSGRMFISSLLVMRYGS